MAQTAAATAAVVAYVMADDMAKRLNTSKRTVQRMTAEGRLPFVKIGRGIRYPVHLVDEVLAAQAEELRAKQAASCAAAPAVDQPRRKRRTVQP